MVRESIKVNDVAIHTPHTQDTHPTHREEKAYNTPGQLTDEQEEEEKAPNSGVKPTAQGEHPAHTLRDHTKNNHNDHTTSVGAATRQQVSRPHYA